MVKANNRCGCKSHMAIPILTLHHFDSNLTMTSQMIGVVKIKEQARNMHNVYNSEVTLDNYMHVKAEDNEKSHELYASQWHFIISI